MLTTHTFAPALRLLGWAALCAVTVALPAPLTTKLARQAAARMVVSDLQLTKIARTAQGLALNAGVTAGGAFGASGALSTLPGVIEYTLIYTNAGPDAAASGVVTDSIPANTIYIDGSLVTDEAAILTANCQPLPNAANATQIKCTAASLSAGATGTITFRVRVPSGVAANTVITNQAQIAANETDINPPDNTSNQTRNLVTTSADLSINKSDLGAAPVAGGPSFAYRLRVNNAGPSDARGVVVADTLNASLAFVAVAGDAAGTAPLPAGWTCTTPAVGKAGTVTCAHAQLAPSAGDQELFVLVRVRPEFTATSITNRATVTTTTPDPISSNDARNVNTTITRAINLTITKAATAAAVSASGNLTYQINVANTGPSTAFGVTVTDLLPIDTTFVSATGTGAFATGGGGCSVNTGEVTCTPASGQLAPGASALITLVVKVSGTASDTVGPNVARIASAQANVGVDSNPVTVIVTRQLDVSLTKESAPAAVLADGQITYTLRVTNTGPADVLLNSVNLSDAIPASTTFLPGSIDLSGAPDFTTINTGSAALLFRNTVGAFTAGETAVIKFRVEVSNTFTSGLIINTATVAAGDDTNVNNNTALATTAVGPNADLALTKTASAGPVVAGAGAIIYTLNVRNNGPSAATGARIIDVIPAGTTVTTVPSGAGFACTGAGVGAVGGTTFTCTPTATPWPINANATITYAVSVGPAVPQGPLTTNAANIATTGANATPDAVPANNTQAAVTTQINAQADLSLIKQRINPVSIPQSGAGGTVITNATIFAGDLIAYRLSVRNDGPSDAQAVVIEDDIPNGASFVAVTASSPNFACAAPAVGATSGTIACTRSTFGGPFPNTEQVFVVLRVLAGTGVTSLTNIARVRSTTTDPNNANYPTGVTPTSNADNDDRSDQITTTVDRQSAVALTKRITGATTPAAPTLAAGELVSYTITLANAGPSNAQLAAAGLRDQLSTDLTFVSFAGTGILSGAACAFSTGALTCLPGGVVSAGTLAAANTVTIVARIKPNAVAGTLTNTATIAVNTVNLGGQLLMDAAPINVVRRADLSVQKTTASTARAGRDVVYTIAFANAGPSDATGVTLTDPIPANTTLQTVVPFNVALTKTGSSNLNATCALTSNQLVCTPTGNSAAGFANGVLPAGYSGTLPLTVRVNANVAVGAMITNQATIASTATGIDSNTSNNTSAVTLTVAAPLPSLALNQAVQSAITVASHPNQISPPSYVPGTAVVPGTALTYLLIINNNELTALTGVQVADTLPTGATFVSATPATGSPFTCQPPASGIVRCNAASLAANSAHQIQITVAIAPETKAALTNSVQATGTLNGASVQSTISSLTTPVAPLSDLQLTATHAPNPVAPGATLTYTLTLRNNGPSTAALVTLIDTLPAGQSLSAAPDVLGAVGFTCGAAGSGTTGAITCTAATLAPSAQAVIKLTALVSAAQPGGTVNNTATATSISTDPTPVSVTDPVIIVASVDLVAAKTAPTTVAAGAQMSYTVTATNNGPGAANNVMISDPLPAGTVFVAATATGSTTLTTPAVNANGTVKATWAGAAPSGTARTLTITVRVGSQVACDTNLVNTATISSDTTETNAANNTATATTKAQASFDLALTKTAPATATPGQVITYVLTVANLGPSNATGVVVTDALPVGLTVMGAPASTLPGAPITVTTSNGVQTVTATLGALGGPNQTMGALPTSATITIAVKVPLAHPFIALTNTATVAGAATCAGQGDPAAANNTARASTNIVSDSMDPGVSYPATAEASDGQAGSVLFFPIYSSNLANLRREHTRISVTNTSGTERACVRLFAVDGVTCSVVDASFCLTANQTVSIQAADIDPGNRGYFVAIAVDCATGLPRAFNSLIGDEFVKLGSGHAANLGATAIQALRFTPAGTDTAAQFATLNFDGAAYTRLPRQLAVDSIPSPSDGNAGLLVLNRIGGDLSFSAAGLGELSGTLFNDQEIGFNFIAQAPNCQLRQLFSNTFPRTAPVFASAIPAGGAGWMKLATAGDFGILGAYLNFNPNTRASSKAYNQGHNLHTLTLAPAATLIISIIVPAC